MIEKDFELGFKPESYTRFRLNPYLLRGTVICDGYKLVPSKDIVMAHIEDNSNINEFYVKDEFLRGTVSNNIVCTITSALFLLHAEPIVRNNKKILRRG